MDKRELLLAICEAPGWQPPTEPPSSVERSLEELLGEGWILVRLDGYEASPKALEQYPAFSGQRDIADPEQWASEERDTAVAPTLDERVAALFFALLKDRMTLGAGEQLVALAREVEVPPDGVLADAARALARALLTQPRGGN